MNWILGLIGALLGAAISEQAWLLGAVTGFFAMFFIGSYARLRGRIGVLERELNVVRARVVAQEQTQPAAPATTAETPVAAPSAEPVVAPRPPIDAVEAPVAPVFEAAQASERIETVEPPPLPQDWHAQAEAEPPRAPVVPVAREPQVFDKAIARIKAWFTEGNVPVKIGVLVLFAGVAAALRYAVAQGYFHLPIEVRLALIALGGVAALAFGWRERMRRPAFGLSLQGGAIGVLLMTVFAAYRMYGLLPPMAAFALVVVLVAGAALLAVLQDAVALGALGFVGGYLAPVLISTGSNDPVGLFSYYAALNAAVFGVSWKRSWRVLNLIGFVFTFGVGTAWGVKFYRPDLLWSVEPFLILFFVFYVVIGLLYVIRQTTHRRPWVDGTLVFGTPLLAFPLQAGLLKDDRMALAISALVVAAVYAGLVWWLRRHRDERLLTESYGALALGFATLAVPLAFSSGTTASVWALEGAGVAWIGIRQNRRFPWLSGLMLQLLAAGSYAVAQIGYQPPTQTLLLNPQWLGAALIAIAGFALSLIHDRLRPMRVLPAALFVWATLWWLFAEATQIDRAHFLGIGRWRFAMGYFAATIAIAALLRARANWPRMGWLVVVGAFFGFWMSFVFEQDAGGPMAPDRLPVWAAYALAMVWALWSAREQASRTTSATHLLGLWTLAAAAAMQARHLAVIDPQLGDGWADAALLAPPALLTFGLLRKPSAFAWPRAGSFVGYRNGWFVPAALLFALAYLAGLFAEGGSAPLAYLPVFNPLELAMLAIAALLYAMCEGSMATLRRIWPYAGFAFATSATLRAVHHWHGEPWSEDVFDSAMSEMALSLVWSLLGVGSWILGSRRGDRRLWIGGAVLMGVVLLKLVVVDRHYMGNIPGIASFLVVGLLLVGVGYIAPSPPKQPEDNAAQGAVGQDKVEGT